MLAEAERDQIIEALAAWAEQAPERPMVGFLEYQDLLTPRQVVVAVQENTAAGEALLEILEYGVRREGIEMVVRRIVSSVGE